MDQFLNIWTGLVIWQKVVVGALLFILATLSVLYLKYVPKEKLEDEGLIDTSAFSKRNIKLSGVALVIFTFVFIVVPYVFF